MAVLNVVQPQPPMRQPTGIRGILQNSCCIPRVPGSVGTQEGVGDSGTNLGVGLGQREGGRDGPPCKEPVGGEGREKRNWRRGGGESVPHSK